MITTSGTLQSAAAATGNGTALNLAVNEASAVLTVSGTFVGTVTFEGTEDNTNWVTLLAQALGTAGPAAGTTTAPGTFAMAVTNLVAIRARVSVYVSGTITVTGHATDLPFTLAAGSTVSVTGLPASLGQKAMAASTGVAIASDQSSIPVTVSTGAGVALTTPQAALTANTDTSYTFGSQVKHVKIQNKSGSAVYVGYDAAATVGSTVVAANGGYLFEDIPCTVVHLLSVPATNVNGAADLNIILQGYA